MTTQVQTLPVERAVLRVFEVEAPLTASFGTISVRRLCLLEIHAGGLVGRGESWVNWPSWAVFERVAAFREGVVPLLHGADALDREGVVSSVLGTLLPLGRQGGAPGPIWQAVSALDVALWDLAAQAAGRPIGALLAGEGARARVPVYASGVGPDRVTALLERALELGFGAAKLKVGFGRERDVAILAEARACVGDAFPLFADANRAWSLAEAVEMTAVLADAGVAWCEEPLADDSPAAIHELHERSGMPLALGENCYGTAEVPGYLAAAGLAHLQPDLSKTGGLSVMRDCGALVAGTGTRLTPHCYGGAVTVTATAQCASAVPDLGWVELDVRDNPFRTAVIREPFRVRDGHLDVPPVTALGDVLDLDALGRLEVHVS